MSGPAVKVNADISLEIKSPGGQVESSQHALKQVNIRALKYFKMN